MANYVPLIKLAQQFISQVLEEGDTVIDATVGNGHDTLFLAQQVGMSGHVYGFDVQPCGIFRTKEKLADAGLQDAATLFQIGHENLATVLQSNKVSSITAAMFNLGYLPSSDKSIQTLTETTLIALQSSLAILKPQGRMTVIAYPGHSGGEFEGIKVKQWVSGLKTERVLSRHIVNLMTSRPSPELFLLEKVNH